MMKPKNIIDNLDPINLASGGWCWGCDKRLAKEQIRAVTESGNYLHFFCQRCWEEGRLTRRKGGNR